MSVKFVIDTSSLRELARDFKDDTDYKKVLTSFIRTFNRSFMKKHSRPYTYGTPTIGLYGRSGPGSADAKGYRPPRARMSPGRDNLRKRSGRLMNAFRGATIVEQNNKGNYFVGYNLAQVISAAPYARHHLNYREDGADQDTVLKPKSAYFYIPLKAATNADGTLKVAPPNTVRRSHRNGVRFRQGNGGSAGDWVQMSYQVALKAGYDFSEESNKFRNRTQLLLRKSNKKPYFILAKKITIPKRLKIVKDLGDSISKPSGYNSLIGVLNKELDRLARKMAR